MVSLPSDYLWSSYQFNAQGDPSEWLVHHPQYQRLAPTDRQRGEACGRLFDNSLEPAQLTELRRCLQTGTSLGNDRFREHIEAVLKVKLGQSTRGRPHKAIEVDEEGAVMGQKALKALNGPFFLFSLSPLALVGRKARCYRSLPPINS